MIFSSTIAEGGKKRSDRDDEGNADHEEIKLKRRANHAEAIRRLNTGQH